MNPISRREFVKLTAAGAVAAPSALHAGTAPAITAQEVVERIKRRIGTEWKAETVDTFKAGDPATKVNGIVTTTIATMPVLRQAAKAGANLVITCEPTFYSKSDAAAPPAGRRGGPPPAPDPVFSAKNEFIRNNGLVIWRFSDHWRLRKPDPLAIGLTDALGWTSFRAAGDAARVTIPVVSLDALASDLKKKLSARGGIRVVGDPKLKVQKIGLLSGTTPIQAALEVFPGVDAVIAGEVREWESVEYAHDQLAAGGKRGLILLGRVVSEDAGMKVCAQWIKSIVPEVATTWVSVGDPYWRPS
jgi:putative NIF3 family GTP cyclohydrolase 1 type 2